MTSEHDAIMESNLISYCDIFFHSSIRFIIESVVTHVLYDV